MEDRELLKNENKLSTGYEDLNAEGQHFERTGHARNEHDNNPDNERGGVPIWRSEIPVVLNLNRRRVYAITKYFSSVWRRPTRFTWFNENSPYSSGIVYGGVSSVSNTTLL